MSTQSEYIDCINTGKTLEQAEAILRDGMEAFYTRPQLGTLRRARGLSIEELAVQAKVRMSIVVYIERYFIHPASEVKKRLATALGVLPNEIWLQEPVER